jgi:WD40 repeat protein
VPRPLEQILIVHTAMSDVAVAAEGDRFVGGGLDGTVRVWSLATGREEATLTGHNGYVKAVAVTADGTRAVSGGDDGTVRVWNLATGHEEATLTRHKTPVVGGLHVEGHPWAVTAVAVTADGARAVSGGHRRVCKWDLAPGSAHLSNEESWSGWVWSVAVSADGTRAVSGCNDGTVRVWYGANLTGHDGSVNAVAVSADGTSAFSGGADGTIRVWDLTTGRAQATFTGHGRVSALAVTGDGARVVSSGIDGTVRVWS